eukprot:CAMPEP_0177373888 /NCGR_PEP_ID=MMETSP0368-20130122/43856_1 /TAXON_ID=447022 ORGANISM="Scrippsiella hangoei-like, Strain SHHI-4" /NCGR_SAMPLE_ID=MMETSP0368 /ASSEMBLY_ACC=CAM_ASM_000363 /LENGTH=174 /DNA_ID=CAMNT_0018837431 /DNA_START=44 /DNA_END=568 /DNA_ORIENTATION=+
MAGEGTIVHSGVTCDICETCPVVGQVFNCDICHDFDLCGSCLARMPGQHPPHSFTEKVPAGAGSTVRVEARPSAQHIAYLKRAVQVLGAGAGGGRGGRGGGLIAVGDISPEPNSWAALVGTDADDAVAAIKAVQPRLQVFKVNDGDMLTCDVREDRVRVYADARNKVSKPPRIH